MSIKRFEMAIIVKKNIFERFDNWLLLIDCATMFSLLIQLMADNPSLKLNLETNKRHRCYHK